MIAWGRRHRRKVWVRPSSVVPAGQAAVEPPLPIAGTAVQLALVAPKLAVVELQVQPSNAVSVGPLSAPT